MSACGSASFSGTALVCSTVPSSKTPSRSMRRMAIPQIHTILPGCSFCTTGSALVNTKSPPSALTERSARSASSRLTATTSLLHSTSNLVGFTSRTFCR